MRLWSQSTVQVFVNGKPKHPGQCRYSRSDLGCCSRLLTILLAQLVYFYFLGLFLPRTLVLLFSVSRSLLAVFSSLRKTSFSNSTYLNPHPLTNPAAMSPTLQLSFDNPRPARDPKSSSLVFIECLLNISFVKQKTP